MSSQLQQDLAQPFPPEAIRQKPGPGGRPLDYVPWGLVARRWNELIPEWTFSVDRLSREGHYWLAVVTVDAPGLGRRTNVGSAVGDHEDTPKSAVSDALKRCFALFGLGLHLWADVEEEHPPAPAQAQTRQPKRTTQPQPRGNGGSAGAGITDNQVKAIMGISKRLGMSEEDLQETIRASFNAESLNGLNRVQASELIGWLQQEPENKEKHHGR
jgi:hypothetical protein